jgi:hypothetical protein
MERGALVADVCKAARSASRYIERISNLVDANPDLLEARFYFEGSVTAVPGIRHTNHPSTSKVHGYSEIYPLLEGERIWVVGGKIQVYIANVKLITGEAQYNNLNLVDVPKTEKSGYGTGEFGENQIRYGELERIWSPALVKIKACLE